MCKIYSLLVRGLYKYHYTEVHCMRGLPWHPWWAVWPHPHKPREGRGSPGQLQEAQPHLEEGLQPNAEQLEGKVTAGIKGLQSEDSERSLSSLEEETWREMVKAWDALSCASMEIQGGVETLWGHLLPPNPFSCGRGWGPGDPTLQPRPLPQLWCPCCLMGAATPILTHPRCRKCKSQQEQQRRLCEE